jgi:hypothetical protein
LDNHLIDLKFQWPQDDPIVKNAVDQVMGYLNFNCLKCGLLSSYEHTWFQREGDRLFMLKAMAFDNLNPTLYRCIGYFSSLVRTSSTELRVDPPLRRRSRVTNYAQMNESPSASDVHPDNLEPSDNSIPLPSSSSIDLPDVHGEAWGFYFLASNFIEGKHPNQLQEVQVNLDTVLDKVRRTGVVHGDVKPRNVIITPNNDMFLIDLMQEFYLELMERTPWRFITKVYDH